MDRDFHKPPDQRATFVGISFCVRNLVGFGIGSAFAGRFLDLWIHHKTVEQPCARAP